MGPSSEYLLLATDFQSVCNQTLFLVLIHTKIVSMTTEKPADSKREEYRKYLEKAGVLDALTKVLVGLYEEPEKPNNALDFLKMNLGANGPEAADIEALKLEVTELRQKTEQLTEENAELKQKLQQYEPAAEEAAPEN